jgi:hypothetical protein
LANIKGKISSGNNGSSDNGLGALNISSSSGVVIANKLDSFGSQTETIDATAQSAYPTVESAELISLAKYSTEKATPQFPTLIREHLQ